MPDTVLFQDSDDISESNLARLLARNNSSDYVERGFKISADQRNNTVTIGSGMAVVADSSTNRGYIVLAEQRQNLPLPLTGGTNHVYLTIDPTTQDSVSIQLAGDDSRPSNPSLKIAEIDTENDTSTELNRAPDLEVGSVRSDGVTVYDSETTTVGDGGTGANHESVRTAVLNNEVWMDPDTVEWADALEDAFDRSTAGAHIVVPPVVYEVNREPSPPPHEVFIDGQNASNRVTRATLPALNMKADVTAIQGKHGTVMGIRGLTILGSGVALSSSNQIHLHHRSFIDSLYIDSFDGAEAIYLEQAQEGDKPQGSVLTGITGRQGNSAIIAIENTTGNQNQLNYCRVEVEGIVSTTRGVDYRGGSGGYVDIRSHQGVGSTGPAVDYSVHNGGFARLQRAEGNTGTPIMDLAGSFNVGVVQYAGHTGGDLFNFDGSPDSIGWYQGLNEWYGRPMQTPRYVLNDAAGDGNRWVIDEDARNSDLTFWVNDGSSLTRKMTLDTAGNLNIAGTVNRDTNL
ncbi:hypothetical protein [Haloarchaeobius baliensis]|uniref:hypothetical protein n=1 Tax=Haloarchaeobius baliensis TaxID=1670458 RepID=UPI003F8840E4